MCSLQSTSSSVGTTYNGTDEGDRALFVNNNKRKAQNYNGGCGGGVSITTTTAAAAAATSCAHTPRICRPTGARDGL